MREININITTILLYSFSIYYYISSSFLEGGETHHILGAIFLIGSILYGPKKDEILYTWSFKSNNKKINEEK